jgi:hypothetical protein
MKNHNKYRFQLYLIVGLIVVTAIIAIMTLGR